MNALAPERAGVVIERSIHWTGVERACAAMLRVPTRLNLLVVQAIANVRAGGRLRETIRAAQRGTNQWKVVSEDGDSVLIWIAQDATKADLEGRQPQPRPKAVSVPRTWLAAAPGAVTLRVGEEEMVSRMAGTVIRRAGGVASVTVARRAVATATREVAEDLGLDDAAGVALVRDVLDHRPGSPSTWRYLPTKLGARAKANLESVARSRN